MPDLPEQSTVNDVLDSVVSNMDQNPEFSTSERAEKIRLESTLGKDKLKVVLETRREILELQSELQARLGDSVVTAEEGTELKTIVDNLTRKEGAEDRINILEEVETVRDLRELSVDQLIELEDKHEGILLYAFTDFVDDGDAVSLERFETLYKAPTPGTKLKVNFRGNEEAEAKLGVGDLLPPSVRRITVYPGGDESLARTSTKRVGLKGQNKSGNGFFDAEGYIPVYSTDVVVVGGVPAAVVEGSTPDTGIDFEFEKKYRDASGKLDYAKYATDHDATDTQFLEGLPSGARRSKYHEGNSLTDKARRALRLDRAVGGNLERTLEKNPKLYEYAHAAREKYAQTTGIDIGEHIMFGVIQLESGFKVDSVNHQGSGASGLFQFINSTWNEYLAKNPWVYEKMANDPEWKDVDQMDWRFNPEIMMDAGYWLATQNMQALYRKRDQIQYSEFKNSTFAKTGKVTTEDAWLLYLPHHDGADGAVRILKYAALREQGVAAREAEAKVGLKLFQKHKHTFKNGRTVYDYNSFIADQHWKTMRAYSGKNVDWARKYEAQLEKYVAGTAH